jgi:L-threonylcarbamoyladenylate synthase
MRLPRWRWGEPLEPLRQVLERGGVLVIPTESSYGLAVDPRDERGVEAVYRLKERERGKPLPVVIAAPVQLRLLEIEDRDGLLGRFARFWPAPLSLVLPTRRDWPAGAGSRSLAVRIPRHRPLRELLAALGHPLTATSANAAGGAPLLDPDEVDRWLAEGDAVLVDEGRLCGGPPSTVISAQPAGAECADGADGADGGVVVIRQGAFDLDAAQAPSEEREST